MILLRLHMLSCFKSCISLSTSSSIQLLLSRRTLLFHFLASENRRGGYGPVFLFSFDSKVPIYRLELLITTPAAALPAAAPDAPPMFYAPPPAIFSVLDRNTA